jgi:acylphosphatase
MSEHKTEQVIFRGQVQGVGFRYTVQSIAKLYPVKGYVKNLPDRSVVLVMQGHPSALSALLMDISDHFQNNIADCERRELEGDEVFTHFEIRY